MCSVSRIVKNCAWSLWSALNGSNGEHTNTDDIDAPTIDDALDKLDRKMKGNSGNRSYAARRVDSKKKQNKNKNKKVGKDELGSVGSVEELTLDQKIEGVVAQAQEEIILHNAESKAKFDLLELSRDSEIKDLAIKRELEKLAIVEAREFITKFCVVPGDVFDHPNDPQSRFISGWDGKEVVTFIWQDQTWLALAHNGLLYPTVREGSVVRNSIVCGYGYVDVDTRKGRPCFALSATFQSDMNSMTLDGKYYPPCTYIVFVPLYTKLASTFPTTVMTDQVAKAANQYAMKYFLPLGLACEQTVSYFILYSHLKHLSVRGRPTYRQMVTTNSTTPHDRVGVVSREMVRVGIDVEHGERWRVYSIECPIKQLDHWMKEGEDVEVRCTGGCTYNPSPLFATHLEVERWYRTWFIRFNSTDAPFHVYSRSNLNVELALRRLVGLRDYDRVLTYYADAMLAAFLDVCEDDHWWSIPESFLKILGVRKRRAKIPMLTPGVCGASKLTFTGLSTSVSHLVSYNWVHKRIALELLENFRHDKREFLKQFSIRRTSWLYKNIFHATTMVLTPVLSRRMAANLEHQKKKLRQVMVNGQLLHDASGIMVSRPEGELKREDAKWLKAGRIYVKYQDGAMYFSEGPEFVKVLINGEYHFWIGSLEVHIVSCSKLEAVSITEILMLLVQARKNSNFLIFINYGDDSCVSGCVDGHSLTKNLDVSSCDLSNRTLPFLLVLSKLSLFDQERAIGLVKQCTLPIRVRSKDDHEEFFDFKFREPKEGSGSTCTTILNFDALKILCISIAHHLYALASSLGQDQIDQTIIMAARSVGYNITIDDCSLDGEFYPEKIQFLKHSLFMTNKNRYVAALNYGALMRNLGGCDQDITPEKIGVSQPQMADLTYPEMMEIMVSGVIKGHVHEPSSSVLEALRSRFCKDTSEIFRCHNLSSERHAYEYVPAKQTLDVGEYILDESLVRRYSNLTVGDIEYLCEQIRCSQYGCEYNSRAVTEFFRQDYGVSPSDILMDDRPEAPLKPDTNSAHEINNMFRQVATQCSSCDSLGHSWWYTNLGVHILREPKIGNLEYINDNTDDVALDNPLFPENLVFNQVPEDVPLVAPRIVHVPNRDNNGRVFLRPHYQIPISDSDDDSEESNEDEQSYAA
jgi:hypothetical protein